MCTNWEGYYQVRPTDSVVTSSQQRPQTSRDSRTARATVEPQAPPQEKNIRPIKETAEDRKKNEPFNP